MGADCDLMQMWKAIGHALCPTTSLFRASISRVCAFEEPMTLRLGRSDDNTHRAGNRSSENV